MKNLPIILFFTLSSCLTKNKIAGLYGQCNPKNKGYICSQLLLNKDSSYIFYNLLHLRGWSATKGKWNLYKDTLILNSSPILEIKYLGNTNSDSVVICSIFQGKKEILTLYESSNKTYATNQIGHVKINRKDLTDFSFLSVNGLFTNISLDSELLNISDTVQLFYNDNPQHVIIMNNDKWIKRNNKLYYPTGSTRSYDKELYLRKTNLSNLAYKSD